MFPKLKKKTTEEKTMKKTYTKGIFLAILIILSMSVVLVIAQQSDDAAVSVTVGNSPCTVSTVEYVDASYATETAFDPDDTTIYGINVTIGDDNTLADLDRVEFYLYDDSDHGGDPFGASHNGYTIINATWTESTGSWGSIAQGSFTEWTEQTSIDPGTASGLSTFEFTFRFDMSRGFYAATDIEATVRCYDDQGATNDAAAPGFVQANNYFAITISGDKSMAFGGVTSLSTNNTYTDNKTLEIYANTDYELRFDALDWTPVKDMETINAFVWDEDGVEGGLSLWVRNTEAVGLGSWASATKMTATENPITSWVLYFWFTDTGDFVADQEYTTTLTIYVYADV